MEENIIEKLKKSEEDIKAGRVYDARAVLAELSKKIQEKNNIKVIIGTKYKK